MPSFFHAWPWVEWNLVMPCDDAAALDFAGCFDADCVNILTFSSKREMLSSWQLGSSLPLSFSRLLMATVCDDQPDQSCAPSWPCFGA